MDIRDCPSREDLEALRLGNLPAEEAAFNEKHLVGCQACQDLFAAMDRKRNKDAEVIGES